MMKKCSNGKPPTSLPARTMTRSGVGGGPGGFSHHRIAMGFQWILANQDGHLTTYLTIFISINTGFYMILHWYTT
jgi:hypothetical protein